MRAFVRNSIWDCLLVAVISIALTYTLCSGFYSTQLYQEGGRALVMVALCVFEVVVLFALTWNTRTLVVGSIVLAVLFVVVYAVSISTSATEAAIVDKPGNNLYIALLVTIVPLLVFVLTRTRKTLLVLIVIGTLLIATIEYLYWYGHVIACCAFIVSAAALYAYRVYQASLQNSESSHFAFTSVSLAGILLAALALLVSVGVFAFVVAPLNPPNIVVKLLTEHFRTNEMEVKGTATTILVPDENKFSNKLGDGTVETSDINNDFLNRQNDDASSLGDANTQDVSTQLINPDSLTDDDGTGGGMMSLEFPDWLPFVLLVLLCLLIVGSIILKKYSRKRRYVKMLADGNDAAVVALYLFFLERFRCLKVPQPQAMTLNEYVASFSGTFKKFENIQDDPAFVQLTRVYVGHVYGGVPVNDDQCTDFKEYYRRFYKRVRLYVGRIKYCFLFFRV